MAVVLAYVPATGQTVPVMVPDRILEGRRPESSNPLEQQTSSRYHRLLSFLANRKQYIDAWRNLRHNQKHCALYRLPDELHIDIAQYLGDQDLLRYTHSSRRTSFLMYKLASKPRFRVCEHKSYSPGGLEHAMWSRQQITLRATLCNKHLNRAAGILGPELGMLWEQGAFVAVVTATHVLCQLPRDPVRSADTIQTALRQLAIHICPHLDSSDDAVWDVLKNSLGRQNGEVVAKCTHCGAAYGMVREAMGMGVALNVQRRVRGLEDPDSRKVLMHLEDCSPRVRVDDDTNGAGRTAEGVGMRGWAEWMLGLVVGLVVLALLWMWLSLLVRRRVASRLRRGLGGTMSSEAVSLGRHYPVCSLVVYVAYLVVCSRQS
jgi:hypothetical protein